MSPGLYCGSEQLVSKAEESFDAAFSNIIDFNHKPLLKYLLTMVWRNSHSENASILVPVCHQLYPGRELHSVWMPAGTDSLLWKGAHDLSSQLPSQAVLGLLEDASSLGSVFGNTETVEGHLSRSLADKRPSWEQDAMIPTLSRRGSQLTRVFLKCLDTGCLWEGEACE